MKKSIWGPTVPFSVFSAVIVEPDMTDVLVAVSALTTVGIEVTVAEGFHEAKSLVILRPPSILLTEIRLGEHNGLQLVLRGKSARPRMAAVVTSRFADPVIQADAEQIGATFLLKPAPQEEVVAAVLRTLFQPVTDAKPAPIRAPFERRVAERRTLLPAGGPSADRRKRERRRNLSLLMSGAGFLG